MLLLYVGIFKQKHSQAWPGNNYHGYTKGKSCLTSLTAFCDEMTMNT